MQTTVVYEKLAEAWIGGKRHIYLEGGTAASKTISILQLLYLVAKHSKGPLLISCVSESIPHMKRGCLRDLQGPAVMGNDFDFGRFNKTDLTYSFDKAKMEFFSADDPSKQRGARRDILFVNEANNIPYDAFRELDARTRLCTICDWNPTSSFWYYDAELGKSPDATFIHATYKDALNVIPPEVVQNIEAMGARDPNWANVYLHGRLGKIEGLVYPYFEVCDEMPSGDAIFGLDFGYSNDPTALIKTVTRGDVLYSQELIYEAGLTNDAIAHRMDEVGVRRGHDEIFADSAEPKSIDEIARFGFNIKPCPKGADSVEFGHQKVRQLKHFWTKDSLNGIKEQRNFRYVTDKDGRLTDKTTHAWSHCLVAGTMVKTYRGDVPIEQVTNRDMVATRRGWKRVLWSGMTSNSEAVERIAFSDGSSLIGTPDHPIYVEGTGYTCLHACRYGDIIQAWHQNESCITAEGTHAIPHHQTGLIGSTSGALRVANATSTAKSGLMQMGRFLKGMRFTTKTAIRSIMTSAIWSAFRTGCMPSSTLPICLNGNESGSAPMQMQSEPRPLLGMDQKKGGSGIGFMGWNLGSVGTQERWPASIAEKSTRHWQRPAMNTSALTNASRPTVAVQEGTTKAVVAVDADRRFRSTATANNSSAPVFVVQTSGIPGLFPVFDLTVQDAHEFYANGILVHNSMDARRYAVIGHALEPEVSIGWI
jgi:phage terminase large subunit